MRKQSGSLELADLTLFRYVVELRSFSAAAAATRTTTSAASKRISRLEDRLGARLLERTTRRVLLSEAGATFYARVLRILSDLDEAENEVACLGGAPRGTLRVSAPVIFGERHLAPLLPTFLNNYPDLRVDLSLSDHFVNLLAERFDVALRIGSLVDSTLVRVKIGVAASLVVAAPGYLARAGNPEAPRDLAQHNCIRYSNIPAAREWRFRSPEGELSIPVVGKLEANHGGAILDTVVAGMGIARLPDFLVADALRRGQLVRLLEDFDLPPTGIHLVYPKAATPVPKLRVFIEEIGAALRTRVAALRTASN